MRIKRIVVDGWAIYIDIIPRDPYEGPLNEVIFPISNVGFMISDSAYGIYFEECDEELAREILLKRVRRDLLRTAGSVYALMGYPGPSDDVRNVVDRWERNRPIVSDRVRRMVETLQINGGYSIFPSFHRYTWDTVVEGRSLRDWEVTLGKGL